MRVLIIVACLLSLTASFSFQSNFEPYPTPTLPSQDQTLSSKMIKTELQNYKDMMYTMQIEIGTPPQKKRLHLDTGSDILWVASPICLTCKKIPRFEIGSSSTYKNLEMKQQLPYLGGIASGVMVQDAVKFGERQALQFFVLVDQVDQSFSSYGDFQVSGIIGVGRSYDLMKIFYGLSFFDHGHFAIDLGSKKFNQKSYLYSNVSSQDFPNAKYFEIEDKSHFWQIHIERFEANNEEFDAQSFVIDSGASITSFKKQLYKKIHKKYFQNLCKPIQISKPQQIIWKSKPQKILYKCDCDFTKYPTFKLISNQTTLDFSPFMYMLEYEDMCILNIKQLKEDKYPNILGDNFIRHYTVVFDNPNNRIGFVEKQKIKPYVSDSVVILGLQIMCILVILATARIFFTGKHMHLIYDNFRVSSSNVFETGNGVMIGSSYDD